MANWTPDEVEQLKALAAGGASRLRIAAKLGRSISSITATAKQHGISIKTAGEIRKARGLGSTWAENRDCR